MSLSSLLIISFNNSHFVFFSYNASSFNCSSAKYSFSFTVKSLRSLKQIKEKEIRWSSQFPGQSWGPVPWSSSTKGAWPASWSGGTTPHTTPLGKKGGNENALSQAWDLGKASEIQEHPSGTPELVQPVGSRWTVWWQGKPTPGDTRLPSNVPAPVLSSSCLALTPGEPRNLTAAPFCLFYHYTKEKVGFPPVQSRTDVSAGRRPRPRPPRPKAKCRDSQAQLDDRGFGAPWRAYSEYWRDDARTPARWTPAFGHPSPPRPFPPPDREVISTKVLVQNLTFILPPTSSLSRRRSTLLPPSRHSQKKH